MSRQVEIKVDNNTLCLCGDLDFNNVMGLRQQGLQFIAKAPAGTDIHIDFGGLATANSAAIALIIDWMQAARKLGKKIQFMHISAEIAALAGAAGLDRVIGNSL